MTDFRSFFDREYLGAWDLAGREVTVVIAKVRGVELVGQGARKSKKPAIWFEGKDKGLPLNKTNAKTIAALYGKDVEGWIGKAITIYPTTTTFGNETHDCIRVRPSIPERRRAPQRHAPEEQQREPAAEDQLEPGALG